MYILDMQFMEEYLENPFFYFSNMLCEAAHNKKMILIKLLLLDDTTQYQYFLNLPLIHTHAHFKYKRNF